MFLVGVRTGVFVVVVGVFVVSRAFGLGEGVWEVRTGFFVVFPRCVFGFVLGWWYGNC